MRKGFSLVELSIVLVILGLLVGGILAGKSLIRAAELRAVGAEYSRYQTAVQAFRDKYFALPGDMVNATSIWGKDSAACNGQSGNAATPGTCNGDGSNGLDDSVSAASSTAEMFQSWKQLALAGLIEGQYTGLTGPTNGNIKWGGDARVGVNIPASKLGGAGWGTYSFPGNYGGYFGNGEFLAPASVSYGNFFLFGGERLYGGSGTYNMSQVLTPGEAWNIDTKWDDGQPASGKIINVWFAQCILPNSGGVSATNLDVRYNVGQTTALCALAFLRSF